MVFLLYEGSTIHNASDQFVSCVYFFFVDFAFHPSPQTKIGYLYAPISNSCIFTPIENWTHVYMDLFTQNSPYYHLLKYLLFLLKHPVYNFPISSAKLTQSTSISYTHFNNILPSTLSSKRTPSLRFPTKTQKHFSSPHASYTPSPSTLP